MVVDSEWEENFFKVSEEDSKTLNGNGYTEINTGRFVPEEDAFDYAMEQCVLFAPESSRKIKWTQEFKEMFVEWFYSGNWVKEE